VARLSAITYLGVVGLLSTAVVWPGPPPSHPSVRTSPSGQPDFATCAECHADKASGQTVHAAVQAGCDTCHAVEQDEDESQVRLTLDGNELCFTCHQDKQPQPSQITLHFPVRKEHCTVCHDAHSTQAPHLLRQNTESRLTAENLCLSCHGEIAAQIQKPVQHAAVDMGCSACHTTHKTEPSDQPEGRLHLAQGPPDLCLSCHDAADAALEKAHSNQPFANSRCTECHNPHGSEQAKLLNNFVHRPFGEKQCETCHEPPKEGKVVLVEGAQRELCLGCHADMQERLDKAKTQHTAVSGGDCIACHSPHAATFPHQIRRNPVGLCLTCHADFAQARVTKTVLHQPAFEQSCLICHAEHAGERPQRLRAEANNLCLECHGSQNRTKFQSPGEVKLFDGSVTVNAVGLAGMRILSIPAGATKGHPYAGHPVAGEGLTCLTCHRPHDADGSPKLLVTETPTPTPLCLRCHK